jgi:hypothetical protein
LSATPSIVSYETPAAGASAAPSKAARWTGRVLSGLAAAFLLMDAVMKFVKPEPVIKGTVDLGFSENVIVPLGVTLLVSTLLYVFPRTAVLGAILLTGYLGGAVCTHVRVANPLFTHVLFPTYLGALIWGGLLFRDLRLRALLPFRSNATGL